MTPETWRRYWADAPQSVRCPGSGRKATELGAVAGRCPSCRAWVAVTSPLNVSTYDPTLVEHGVLTGEARA